MYDVTPQERLALVVIAVLITGGATARHLLGPDAAAAVQFTTDAADTLSAGSALRTHVAEQVARDRLRNTPLADGERIDPNTAPADQLDRLPGVGPALADRIVEHRRAAGRFRSLGDLGQVRGIGPAALERIAPFVTLADRPASARETDRVDLNRASAEALDELPGIGPAIAERIVAYRSANGRFRSWQELENVSGIGPRLRERLQGVARLGP